MKGLDPKRMSELFRSNSKTHFKMYKAGRKWLVAGISALSGLLGLGTIGSTSAKADTKTGAAKTLDTEDVAATKTTGTIPATSQATVQASTTDVSQSTSDQTSTQETSTTPSASATSETGNQAAETTTNATGSATTGAQSAQNETTTDDQVTTTETTADGTQPTTTQTTADQTATNSTAQKMDTTNENSTTGSTNEASESTDSAGSASESTAGSDALASDASASGSNDTTTITTDELKTMLATTNLTQENQNKVALMAASFSLTRAAALDLVNAFSTPKQADDPIAYKQGIADATRDINNLVSSIQVTNALSISSGFSKLTDLFKDYDENQSLQESNETAAPVWTSDNYQASGKTSTIFGFRTDETGLLGVVKPQHTSTTGNTKDYNQGYSDYTRDFISGTYQWLDGVASQAKNEVTANSLLNGQTYDSSALSGDGSAGSAGAATGAALATIIKDLLGTKYASDVLAFNNISGNIANSSISTLTNNLNPYIGIIAPNLINGIAKQALSDVRSIGGTMDDSDYAPATLEQAVGLNKATETLVSTLGMKNLLSTNLFQHIYEALVANAKAAIENSWAIGEDTALKGFLQNGHVYGGSANSPYASTTGYSETNPAQIMSSASDGKSLSSLAEAAGYAWTQKVIGNVMTIANVDALGGQEKTNITEIVNQLVASGKLSADEANEILNRNSVTGTTDEAKDGVAHVFDTSNSALNYVRNGSGAQQVIEQLYNAEYAAAKAALTDYLDYPNMTDQHLADNQAKYTYVNPAYKGLATHHDPIEVGIYTQIMHALWMNDTPYRAMIYADALVHATAIGDTDGSNGKFGIAAAKSLDGKTTFAKEDAGTLTTDNTKLLGLGGRLVRDQMKIGNSSAYDYLPDFTNVDTDLYGGNLPDNAPTKAQSDAMVTYMNSYVYQVFDKAYASELAKATRAFRAGQALAEQKYEESINGQIPSVKDAGSYSGFNYQDDGSADDYIAESNYTSRQYGSVYGTFYKGRLFTDGYNQNLVTITVKNTYETNGDHINPAGFYKTSMYKTGETTVNTLGGKSVTITAQTPDAGWSVSSTNPVTIENVTGDTAKMYQDAVTNDKDQELSSDNPLTGSQATTAVTFKYTQQASYNYDELQHIKVYYDTQNASTMLPDTQTIYPSWNNGVNAEGTTGAQSYQISKDDLVIANDGTKVGDYAYHLTDAGAQKLLDYINSTVLANMSDTTKDSVAVPTVASLTAYARER